MFRNKEAAHLIPAQVSQMLDSLLNTKDSVHLRANYRMRLDAIRREIDTCIKIYDNEVDSKSKRKS